MAERKDRDGTTKAMLLHYDSIEIARRDVRPTVSLAYKSHENLW